MTQAIAQIVVDLPEPAAPQPHTHAIADVDALPEALENIEADMAALGEDIAGKAAQSYVDDGLGELGAGLAGMVSALAGKAAADHTHPLVPHRHDASEIDNLPAPGIIPPPEPSEWGPTLQSEWNDALSKGRYARFPDFLQDMNVETTIHVEPAIGAFGGGIIGGLRSVIKSHVTNGQPVLVINPKAPTTTSYVALEGMTFEKFQIRGSGDEIGCVLAADRPSTSIHNFRFRDVAVMNCKVNWHVINNVFEGGWDNCYANRAVGDGVIFENNPNKPGVISTLQWHGGAVRENGGDGFRTAGWSRGVSASWVQFISNRGLAIRAQNGWEALSHITMENNCDVPTEAEWQAWLAEHPGASDPHGGKRWTRSYSRAGAFIENYLGSCVDVRCSTGYFGSSFPTHGFQDYGFLLGVQGTMTLGAGTKQEGYGNRTGDRTPPLAKLTFYNSTGRVFVSPDARGAIEGGVLNGGGLGALYTKAA